MRTKKVVWLAAAAIVLALCTAAGAVFAWFHLGTELIDVEFTSGYVELTTSFWHGVDSDGDGVLDREEGEDGSRRERYEETDRLAVAGLYPSRTEVYKLVVENAGNVPSLISISWGNFAGTSAARDSLLVGADIRIAVNGAVTEQHVDPVRLSSAESVFFLQQAEFGDGLFSSQKSVLEIVFRITVDAAADSTAEYFLAGQTFEVGRIALVVESK